ncbi:VOC family protein [Amnibacterium flavum]|uniref:VOC domain-containing protein n=1 Tax=Amnibacterium flavum TaxID=2173173 RepID=A0A2V1HV08_9MICO|nr:VOC family protein [Amnibacterium flavum]PVZ95552.1 hypothetical protein DDQ50_03370 [Amnibacterium flavum]
MTDTQPPSDSDATETDLARSESVNTESLEEEQTLISELRLVIECEDWDSALAFYRDALGLRQIQGYQGDTDAQMILDVGRATIELVHPELPSTSSPTDLTAPPVPKTRLAFRTSRAQSVVKRLEGQGASRVEGPRLTTSDTLSVRLIAPDNMPITVFRPLGSTEFAETPETPE